MRGETLLQGRTRCGRYPSGRTASDLASRLFGALALTTTLSCAVFWAGPARATIVKNATIAQSQDAAFDPVADRVGALVYTNASTGSNSLGGTVFMLDEVWGYMTGHSAERNGNGFSNPKITFDDRDLLDGFFGHTIAEIIFHPDYFSGCEQGRCIDLALFRLETPISGIEPITIGTRPEIGEQITFFGFGRQGVFPDVAGTFTGKMNAASNRVDGYGPGTGDSRVWPEYFGVSIRSTSTATDVPLEGIAAQFDSGCLAVNASGEAVGLCVADLGGWNTAFLSLDTVDAWRLSYAVPEPGTALLTLLGVTGLAARARRH